MIQNWVRLPHPERDLETQTTYSRTALKHDGEDSQNSGAYTLQVLSSSVPCEARTRGGGEALRAKNTFFLCRQRTEMTHHYRRHCSRASVRWRDTLFCFLFSDPTIVGLKKSFFFVFGPNHACLLLSLPTLFRSCDNFPKFFDPKHVRNLRFEATTLCAQAWFEPRFYLLGPLFEIEKYPLFLSPVL